MELKDRVIQVSDDQIQWPFEGAAQFRLKTPKSEWPTTVNVDPFPCYSHDKKLIEELAGGVERKFKIGFNTFYFILPFEASGRTNAAATNNTVEYGSERKRKEWEGVIYFSGKRIPIHPAMSRYLVAHEYGHVVDNWICTQRGLKDNGLDNEYAAMRGIEPNGSYGGRRWHLNIGEIIANDFRIAICGAEREFWPHPGVEHPDNVAAVNEWWYKALLEYSV